MSAKRNGDAVVVQPPQFDRPEVEIRASTRRTKTGNAHWSGSRVIVQIPARLKGRARDVFVDELVQRLLTQRPQVMASDAALVTSNTKTASAGDPSCHNQSHHGCQGARTRATGHLGHATPGGRGSAARLYRGSQSGTAPSGGAAYKGQEEETKTIK